jgi:DNA-binding XRE family transcriptional regulator
MLYDVELAKKLKNPELADDLDALEPELTIVNSLQALRTEYGLTQTELSEISGVSQGDISKIERGLLSPTIKSLKKLAKALKVRVKVEFVPIGPPRP